MRQSSGLKIDDFSINNSTYHFDDNTALFLSAYKHLPKVTAVYNELPLTNPSTENLLDLNDEPIYDKIGIK